jgi:hypothetical protein
VKGLSERRRRRLERELASMRERLSQLRAELEEASLRGRWLELDEDRASVAEGRAWGKQAAALRTAISELEQRIFSREIELL